MYGQINECYGTLFSILTFLLDEINVDPTTLCETHSQSVGLTLITPNKRVDVRVSVEKRVAILWVNIIWYHFIMFSTSFYLQQDDFSHPWVKNMATKLFMQIMACL